ncbi:hypothetical protein J3R83DRAFT_5815 [Lanmaoa asiatica]|nr:hypothetical protein J3R83DRAFT_5815 [Lanmaoa asiatica]
MELFEQVDAILRADVATLVEVHFGRMRNRNTKSVTPYVIYCSLLLTERMKKFWLLDLNPATLNTHYYAEYKDKFLAYYKASLDE